MLTNRDSGFHYQGFTVDAVLGHPGRDGDVLPGICVSEAGAPLALPEMADLSP